MRNFVFPLCGILLVAVLAYKARYLRRSSAVMWALCGTIFFFAGAMWSASPASCRWLNRTIGVSNVAELIAASCLAALAASFLVLALHWRYPARVARPKTVQVIVIYLLVIATISVLFALSDVPQERPVDFIYHYGRQPTVGASYCVLYVSTLAGSLVLSRWCFAWARHDDYESFPHLRRGLWLYGWSGMVLVLYSLSRLAALVADWFGVQALRPMGTVAPVIAAVAGCVVLAPALLIPIWGPRWPALRRTLRLWNGFRTLRPLHRALREVSPGIVFVASGRRFDVQHRIRRALIELSDWRWTLAPSFDPFVETAVRARAEKAGLTDGQLAVALEAARLKAALRAWQSGEDASTEHDGLVPADGSPEERLEERDGNDLDGELAWWCQVARAFKNAEVDDVPQPPSRQDHADRHKTRTEPAV
ncbi:hypothetical protein J4573_43025 [Actinomadura barringtoniae]|uniref:DUF6545 domain-containing protein n=1 Tax=Actinomadura barringtoniae TaxID=1427535 RepID=A0A939T965_9ACTN|nr:MAB_1171c family putative transporter [Actinomadura barringtoniae]MBO2453924.1 hypothetical protein [Actinomadura barringtoniae]